MYGRVMRIFSIFYGHSVLVSNGALKNDTTKLLRRCFRLLVLFLLSRHLLLGDQGLPMVPYKCCNHCNSLRGLSNGLVNDSYLIM